MKFSYQWLKEFVPGLAMDGPELGRQITMKTAECDGVERHGEDFVVEIDNKSLTHRPDLWGHHGMAREVAAIAGLDLPEPADLSLLPEGEPGVRVSVADFALCPRFGAIAYENVRVGPSPAWLSERLEAVGLNPINNVVDITNYVLAELPQPMHAFDADKVAGRSLTARAAREGEVVAALNGESYALDPSTIVVAGSEGPLGVAGVIGGAASAISDSTTRVIFEAANWNAVSIRKTSARLKLRTDASMRFEKALDPENTVRGLARAIALMKRVCPEARLAGGLADVRGPASAPAPIDLDMEWLARKLGRSIASSEVVRILRALGFGVEDRGASLRVAVPTWRATKDVSTTADLVEEVGRMIGYRSIDPAPPRMDVRPPAVNRERADHDRLRRFLTANGFDEVQNYSFLSDATARRFGLDPAETVRVVNPISEDRALLRTTLVPGMHRNIEENRKRFDEFRVFEIGKALYRDRETPRLAAAIYSKVGDGRAAFDELKRLASAVVPGVVFAPAAPRVYEHPARVAELPGVGRLFEFHPSFVESGRAAALDIELAPRGAASRYAPVNRFPSSSFDLAVVVGARALAGEVARDLPGAEFVEDYALADGRRSLLFRVTLSAPDRTLTGDEVAAERARRIAELRAKGYDLRA